MNSSSRKFLFAVTSSFLILGAINVAISWYSGYPDGDLTRVGGYMERDWRPRREQIKVEPAPNKVRLDEADVIILGDSFCWPFAWQGQLERLAKVQTLTCQFSHMERIQEWIDSLLRSKLKVHSTLILETVEREFIRRMGALDQNQERLADSVSIEPLVLKRSAHAIFGLDLDIIYNFSLLEGLLQDQQKDRLVSGSVVNVRLANPTRFTSRTTDRLLYLLDDEAKAAWTQSDVDHAILNLEKVKAKLADRGINFLVLLMPDKSSVYTEDIQSPRGMNGSVSQALYTHHLAPFDIQSYLQARRTSVTDLYLPNDTHLSDDGYREVARLLFSTDALRSIGR